METEGPRFRFTISLTMELFDKVDSYQHVNRYSRRTDAIIDLLEKGLATLDKEQGGKTIIPISSKRENEHWLNLATKDKTLLHYFEEFYKMDPMNRGKVCGYIDGIVSGEKGNNEGNLQNLA